MATFAAWDYVVLAVVLLISAGFGVYYRMTGGKQKTTKEYLLADRSMPVLPVAFSLMASFMSAVTLLGVSMENYTFGTQFVVINFAYVIATPIATHIILPVFYNLRTASVYEYLEKRFGFPARLYASLMFSLQMILYMGIVLYAPALALEAVTGLNRVGSIFAIGLVCTFYSTLGGMKAVVMTDVFQSLLMFVAIFSVIICAGIKAGGLDVIWEAAEEGGRIEFDNFSFDPTVRHTWWGLIIGGMFTYLTLYGVNQTQIQRLLSVKNFRSAQWSLVWNLPILMLLSFSTSFSGLCIYWYYKGCDPLLEGRIASRDQLMPLFVVDNMGHIPGLSGLFVSGIFCASLSTISSAISSLAAVTLEDYIKPIHPKIFKKEIPENKTAFVTKIIALLYGLLCIGLAFAAQNLGGVLQASLTIFGVVGGPLFGLFMLGMLTTRANQKGALIGLTLGFIFSFWIGFGQPKPPPPVLEFSTDSCPVDKGFSRVHDILMRTAQDTDYFWLYRLSYMWYSAIGFLVTFVCGYFASWILAALKWDLNDNLYLDKERTVINASLLSPFVGRRVKCFNESSTQTDEIGANSS